MIDVGLAALAFGIVALFGFQAVPREWRHAAGGLLILATIIGLVAQVLHVA